MSDTVQEPELGTDYEDFQRIDEHLAARKPLYIRNCSKHPLSVIVLEYPSAEGMAVTYLPRTTVPFNICAKIEPDYLRSSRAFRDLLTSRTIEVVPASRAKAETKDPALKAQFDDAWAEANNTSAHRRDEARKAREAGSTRAAASDASGPVVELLSKLDPEIVKQLDLSQLLGQTKKVKANPEQQNPRFYSLFMRVKGDNGVAPDVIKKELSSMLSELSDSDLQVVAAGGPWGSAAAEWARERLKYRLEK